MSFSELIESNFIPKEKDVIIKLYEGTPEEKELKFKAIELSATKRLQIHSAQMANEDYISELIAGSILDPEGKKMTLQQAVSLPEKYAALFFIAASEVNFEKQDSEKN